MKEQILVVDDDENDVFFLQNAIKHAGIKIPVHVAHDGRHALNYLGGVGAFGDRKIYPMPALVLLDLKLPHVMGLDVLKWIRQQRELNFPVIILSASRNEADIEAAYRLGANAYLVKPNAVSELDDVVRAIRDFWLRYNTSPAPRVLQAAVENHPTASP